MRSWIWQPQHEIAYVAERGAGAWENGRRLLRPPLGDDLRGVTSRRTWVGRAVGALRALDLTWVCCGVDYPKLVEGAADYALYRRAKPWDHAPGSLLLTEAGGFVGTFDGSPYRPRLDPLSGSSPQPIARPTTSCTTSSTRFPVSDLFARRDPPSSEHERRGGGDVGAHGPPQLGHRAAAALGHESGALLGDEVAAPR